MHLLAEATGGRLFSASSIEELEPIYEQVARDLRSVYRSYYPSNQNFDGKWRKTEVRVKRLGTAVRTRQGYFAR